MYVGSSNIIQAAFTGATVEVVSLASTGNFFVHAGRLNIPAVSVRRPQSSLTPARLRPMPSPRW